MDNTLQLFFTSDGFRVEIDEARATGSDRQWKARWDEDMYAAAYACGLQESGDTSPTAAYL